MCQTGRHRRRLRPPLHRFRLNHTERCCLTGGGRAGGGGHDSQEGAARQTPISRAASYFGHKVVPHAQLGWNELLPVRGPVCGNRRWGGRALLHRASRDQHPHVEPASVSIHILCWRSYRGWKRQFKICVPHSASADTASLKGSSEREIQN